jgi:hypothetical protein
MNPTKINWTTAGLFSLSANDNILINNNISMCVDISLLNKRRISMAEKKDNVSAKFKDNVFCMLYADKAICWICTMHLTIHPIKMWMIYR